MISVVAQGLVKSYGATRALDGFTIQLRSGQVTGIAGPNGAGKSTLTRILAGEEQPDVGHVYLERDGVRTADLHKRVALVHQEPQLWPNLTVLENLAVGREAVSARGIRPVRSAEAILGMLEIVGFKEFQLSDLSLATQQRVEIARAIMSDADVFLFDEPNSALTDAESQALFAIMARLADSGKIVALITHRLNDFVRCCNRVVILKDGRITGELTVSEISESAIAGALMAGAGGADPPGEAVVTPGAPEFAENRSATLQLERFDDPAGRFRSVPLELKRGQITVLAGVEGSGARELVQAVGLQSPNARHSFTLTHGAKVAFVAASRQHTIFPNMSVGENLVARLARSLKHRRVPILSRRKLAERATRGLITYRVKAASHLAPVTSLSGGNQQKVAVGAALEYDPDILVLEEPTRGVDVASKRDIYNLLRQAVKSGNSVLLFCTEVPEIFALADLVVVMSRGAAVATILIDSVASVTALAHLLAEFEAAGPIPSMTQELAMTG